MKIAICEDEAIFSSQIKTRAYNFFTAKGIAVKADVFTDGRGLLERYENGFNFDIVFMDINLENSDGMRTASELRKHDKKALLVFITSVESRAVEGYDVNAFGYIVKNTMDERLPLLLERLWGELGKERLLVLKDNGVICLLTDDVMGVESSGRGAIIHTHDSQFKTGENIGRLSAKLPPETFVECHKSVFVNTAQIRSIDVNFLTTVSGKTFPVSRRCRKAVMTALMRKAGEM